MSIITWITPQLGFGAQGVCAQAQGQDWAVVHACKFPCHRAHVGYNGKIEKTHPHYLAAEKNGHLYLNIIDPPVPLFQKESFAIFFDFIDRHPGQRPLLIHCNQGESRAPSLSLLVMAKRLSLLPDTDYKTARSAFAAKYPYKPGGGISQFLEEHWEVLGQR